DRLWIARRKALVAAFVDEPVAMLRIVRAGMRRHLRRADLRRGRGRRLRLSAHGDADRSGIRPGFHCTAGELAPGFIHHAFRRQLHLEYAALVQLAFDGDAAADELGEAPADREAESPTAV